MTLRRRDGASNPNDDARMGFKSIKKYLPVTR